MSRSWVARGGGQRVGRAIAERLLGDADTVVVERDATALNRLAVSPAGGVIVNVSSHQTRRPVPGRPARRDGEGGHRRADPSRRHRH